MIGAGGFRQGFGFLEGVRNLLEILRYKHLFVLFSYFAAACALSWQGMTAQNFCLSLGGAILIFFAVYGYNYITDRREDLRGGKATPLAFAGEKTIFAFAGACAVAALAVSWLLGAGAFWSAVGILFLGFAYSGLTYSRGRLRLKRYFVVKTLSITIGWFLLFLYFCFSFGTSKWLEAIVIGSFFACVSAGGALLRDVLDVKGDIAAGVRSIPVVLGERKTLLAIAFTIAVNYAIFFASLASFILPGQYAALLGVLPVRFGMVHSMGMRKYGPASAFSLASYFLIAAVTFAVEVAR